MSREKAPRNSIFESVPEGTDTSGWVRPVEPEKSAAKTFPTLAEFITKVQAHLDELPDEMRAVVESGDNRAIGELWSQLAREWQEEQGQD